MPGRWVFRRHAPPGWRAACAALAIALGGLEAEAEDLDPAPLLGVWHRNDFNSLQVERDALTSVFGETRWRSSAADCRGGFDHNFAHRSTASILDQYLGPDFYDPYGEPLDGALQDALPAGEYLTLASACCCPREINGGEELILLDEDSMVSVAWGDGVYDIVRYTRTVPEPSHDDLHEESRRDAQRALQQLSLYGGEVDGLFGPGTEAAIRAFQSSIGAEATGVLSRSQFIRLLYGE